MRESCDAGRRNVEVNVDTLQGVARGCTLAPNMFKVYIKPFGRAIEAAKLGVMVGEGTVSGLVFSDDFVGTSEAPEGLKKRPEKGLEYAGKRRVTANFEKCEVLVCIEDKGNSVVLGWKSRNTHMARAIGKGKTHVGKMDAILTDSHLWP